MPFLSGKWTLQSEALEYTQSSRNRIHAGPPSDREVEFPYECMYAIGYA